MPTDFGPTPPGFEVVPPEAVDVALAAVWRALDPHVAVPRLQQYYRRDGDYAGATFTQVLPIESDMFTAADLFSLTLLSVDAPSPRVARLLLDPGTTQNYLVGLLRSSDLATDLDLAYADEETLTLMARFYDAIKQTLGSDPWVTASKLCARKRPRLFPVRDKLVRGLLGLTVYGNYEVDWQVFRAIMRNQDVVNALHVLRSEAQGSGIDIDPYPLRWLDVTLWMHAKAAARAS